ncbi:MAG: 3-deoxy-manno-octulosonate cytidylyltransferase [Sphaerochaeta sp.]|jgi:3-deoxy-manno-octulosonate cytidylyltransferase (CMP-KDO synthetase)
MKVIGIIPARYGSSRLPGKPLKLIMGKPMIQHVYEQALKTKTLDKVIVATDDQRIMDVVDGFGGEAFMTREDHPSGSDRIAEVAAAFECDIVVNIQGDEPMIQPEIIDEFVEALLADPEAVMSTGCDQMFDKEKYENPNVVKVVSDLNGNALIFSRSVIPYPRYPETFAIYEHIGIYAYRKDFLMKYIELEPTPLMSTESLEQMKVLEHGYKIKVVKTKFKHEAMSVDTPEDLAAVEAIMKAKMGG